LATKRASGSAGSGPRLPLALALALAGHVRHVNLIERQRDHRESEAVSFARARQRPVPTCSSLPP
jgi:hypothetical protein